ncbi:MAG: ATP-binding protein [Snowella sp.]|nr:ATP-binding protein [Snowella sp.]
MPYNQSEPFQGELLVQFHLTVETTFSAVEEILPWFEQNCQDWLDKNTFLQMQIVLVEGFTNIVKYAHFGLSPQTPIQLLTRIFPNLIEIKIWDYGPEFDLSLQLQKELNTSPQIAIEKESNRGLLLMNALSDELSYIRENHEKQAKNCLIIRKKIIAAQGDREKGGIH